MILDFIILDDILYLKLLNKIVEDTKLYSFSMNRRKYAPLDTYNVLNV